MFYHARHRRPASRGRRQFIAVVTTTAMLTGTFVTAGGSPAGALPPSPIPTDSTSAQQAFLAATRAVGEAQNIIIDPGATAAGVIALASSALNAASGMKANIGLLLPSLGFSPEPVIQDPTGTVTALANTL